MKPDQSPPKPNAKPKPKAKPKSKSTDESNGPGKTGPDNLHNVYDKYYKTIFSYSILLEEFFQVFFPQLAKHVDFKKSQHIKSTFIQSDYVDREADIVYSVPIAGKTVYIYILIEHQSKPDKQIFLRLIGYQLALWNNLIAQNKATPLKLPPILPMVFYNGKRKWEIPKKFTKTFAKAPKEIMRFTPNFEYLFFDIHAISDEVLNRGDELIKMPLLLDKYRDQVDRYMKMIFLRLSEKRKPAEMASARSRSKTKSNSKLELDSKSNDQCILDLVRACYFLVMYHTKLEPEQLELGLDSLEIEEEFKREMIQMRKSAAHQIYEKGIQEGMEKGLEKGQDMAKMELAKKLLVENTEIPFIARITGLDINLLSAMKKDLNDI